jgi:DNA-binding MarR family transcriptional regulator
MAARRTVSAAELDGTEPLDQSELRRHAGYFLARARFIAFRAFEDHIGKACGLSPVEFSLMVLLGSNSNVTQKRLSRTLGVAQPNMTGILRSLEERKLVERTRAEADKRVQFVTLTPAGTKLLRQAGVAGKDMDKSWLGRLSNAEQAMLIELLEKISLVTPLEE